MNSVLRASKPTKVCRPIWPESGDPSQRCLRLSSLLSALIPVVTGGDSSYGWSGFEEERERKRKGPVAWPEVAGRPRIGPEKVAAR